MFVGQPPAGSPEIQIQVLHHQIDWSAAGATHEATVRVPAHLEREARVAVVVKGAEALVPRYPQSESLCDPLNRQVAELLKFKLIHNSQL